MNNIHEQSERDFREVLYLLKHNIGMVSEDMVLAVHFLCFYCDYNNYKGNYVEDIVNRIMTNHYNKVLYGTRFVF